MLRALLSFSLFLFLSSAPSFAFIRSFGTKSPHRHSTFGFCVCKQIEYEFSCFLNRMRIAQFFDDRRVIFFVVGSETFFVRDYFTIFILRQTHSLVSFRFNISDYRHITVRKKSQRERNSATSNDFRFVQVSNSMI